MQFEYKYKREWRAYTFGECTFHLVRIYIYIILVKSSAHQIGIKPNYRVHSQPIFSVLHALANIASDEMFSGGVVCYTHIFIHRIYIFRKNCPCKTHTSLCCFNSRWPLLVCMCVRVACVELHMHTAYINLVQLLSPLSTQGMSSFMCRRKKRKIS